MCHNQHVNNNHKRKIFFAVSRNLGSQKVRRTHELFFYEAAPKGMPNHSWFERLSIKSPKAHRNPKPSKL